MAVALKRRRFTIDEYHRMGETGILSEDDRVELIEGEIIEMTPIGTRHASTVARADHLSSSRLGQRAIAWVQNPIDLPAEDSEPQPDVTLLRPRSDFYARFHPGAGDVVLLVEVMDTSVERDRRVKLPVYARAVIREVWLVDLTTDCIELHRQPAPEGFRDVRLHQRGDTLRIDAFPDVAFGVDELLGPEG